MDEQPKIPVTFTCREQYRKRTYYAAGLYLSLGRGPGIAHVAMRVGRKRWATTDDHAAAWLIDRGLPEDRAAQLVAAAIALRDAPDPAAG